MGNDDTSGKTGGAFKGAVPGATGDSKVAPVPDIDEALGSMTGGESGEPGDTGVAAAGGAGGTGLSGVSRRKRLKTAVTPHPNPQTPRKTNVKNPTTGTR